MQWIGREPASPRYGAQPEDQACQSENLRRWFHHVWHSVFFWLSEENEDEIYSYTKEGERTTRMHAARKENETKHGFDSSGSG